MNSSLRIGTRASALARWQADWVAGQLRQVDVAVELVLITTQGDVKSGPIGSLGGQGLFTKEIQRALLDGRIDLAVHSLKDLPTDPIDGLTLAAVPTRESPSDVLVSRNDDSFQTLAAGVRGGDWQHAATGPVAARTWRPEHPWDTRERGNKTSPIGRRRVRRIVLAEAGLKRLGLAARVTQVLPTSLMLPAIGQGALGLETRSDDVLTRQRVDCLNDPAAHRSVIAERELLATLHGGCLAPIGAWVRVEDDRLLLDAVVLDSQGGTRLTVHASGAPDEAERVGKDAAQELLGQGADKLIAMARDA